MGSCFNMTSQIIIVLVLLSMFGMTSLIHLELDVFSISRHQLARAQEVHSLDYLIYKFEIPRITSIGLNQEIQMSLQLVPIPVLKIKPYWLQN